MARNRIVISDLYFENEQTKIFLGDCQDVLRNNLEENSVDAIVTDPPYGLRFMGKKWDYQVPGIKKRRECLRVLKPGGHLLSFGGSRTSHRVAVAIEDAGFEIRDTILWLHGQGFPKSLNVGKAIDKKLGKERAKIRIPAKMIRNPKSIDSGHGIEGGDRPWMIKGIERGYHEKDGDIPASQQAKKMGWLGHTIKTSSRANHSCKKTI